ncbi:MAG: hypothetical protein EA350_01480 [Gemmatimonadales bacterium]|nr:MAG: hypothetical protein EA350_01480 [Gemmatimonadales bacterium]
MGDPRAAAASAPSPPQGRPGAPGEPPASPVHWTARSPLQLRSCPSCGFRGEGIPYFRRAGNLALLAAATLFTYGIGGLAYWFFRRSHRVCPSCGLGWDRSRPLGEGAAMDGLLGTSNDGRNGALGHLRPSGGPPSAAEAAAGSGFAMSGLPSGGGFRRFMGVAVALVGLLILALGIGTLEVVPAIVGGVIGLSGAATFGWGWRALQTRRQALLQRMQREVLRIARVRGGTLTATQVAADMDLTLPAAERILLSLDDGFRITSDITDEGILYFDFRELRLGSGEPMA